MKNKNSAFTLAETLIVVVILGILVAAFSGPIFGVDREGATRILTQQGYTHVEITGYRWFVGSESDFYHTGFRAVSPNGTSVTGTVTKGILFKSATIRFD